MNNSCSAHATRPLPPNTLRDWKPSRACRWNPSSMPATATTWPNTCVPVSACARNVISNGLEQLMTLLILVVGAYTVMNNSDFTIGMLIAFQMYANKVSQPMLRLVGLWQQFQQANMSVQRLGDIMNAPAEPYSVLPSRLRVLLGLQPLTTTAYPLRVLREGKGHIDIEALSFRYADDRPFLYQDFNLKVAPGKVVA